MDAIQMVLIIFIPIVIGGTVLWLIFRNINRKYCELFTKFIEAARNSPDGIKALIKFGDDTEKREIVERLASMENITKVEILKAGKKLSQVRLKAVSKNVERMYLVELSSDDTGWGITQFTLLV